MYNNVFRWFDGSTAFYVNTYIHQDGIRLEGQSIKCLLLLDNVVKAYSCNNYLYYTNVKKAYICEKRIKNIEHSHLKSITASNITRKIFESSARNYIQQEAFGERRTLHVCDLWPWLVTLTLLQGQEMSLIVLCLGTRYNVYECNSLRDMTINSFFVTFDLRLWPWAYVKVTFTSISRCTLCSWMFVSKL